MLSQQPVFVCIQMSQAEIDAVRMKQNFDRDKKSKVLADAVKQWSPPLPMRDLVFPEGSTAVYVAIKNRRFTAPPRSYPKVAYIVRVEIARLSRIPHTQNAHTRAWYHMH
jgi:hypothetical protein